MSEIMLRIIIYTVFISFLLVVLPLPGSVKESNIISDALFLSGNKLAVTFPWKGVLIKPNIESEIKKKVLAHEDCHIRQIEKLGPMTFIIEYNIESYEFERECYSEAY